MFLRKHVGNGVEGVALACHIKHVGSLMWSSPIIDDLYAFMRTINVLFCVVLTNDWQTSSWSITPTRCYYLALFVDFSEYLKGTLRRRLTCIFSRSIKSLIYNIFTYKVWTLNFYRKGQKFKVSF